MTLLSRTTLCAALALSLLALSSPGLIAQRPEPASVKSARKFVNLAYGFEITDHAFDATTVFTPSLKRLVDASRGVDERKLYKLDYDPLCDCQDSDGLEATTETISLGNRQAEVSVALTFHQKETRHLRLTLVWTPTIGWRIDNIATPKVPDLRAFLSMP